MFIQTSGSTAHLFAACLDNLERNMNEADFDAISDCFTGDQIKFLKKLRKEGFPEDKE